MDQEKQTHTISLEDLQEYWRHLHGLKDGELIRVLSIYEMPPWEKICSRLDWRVHRLGGGYFTDKNYGRRGVYRLIALKVANDLKSVATLNRVCGEDPTGTLYIGEATNLATRVNQMRRTARGRRNECSHSAMLMLKRIQRLDYPPEKLGVAMMFTGRSTRGVEKDLLRAYINSFGEMPPLNYRI